MTYGVPDDGGDEADVTHRGGLPAAVARKIVDLPALLRARAAARAQGRRLVQCHGCFDIVHPGHIRHLRQARALGDLLLVSITGDTQISKGAGRPLIPEELRAENLAALDCVDLVYIDPDPTALGLLREVRPDVYVKGKEYENNKDPRFRAERDAVEACGGRVVFSSGDVVFSSTALVAALEQSADPYHQRLAQLSRRADLQGPALYSSISAMRDRRIVIVGESIIDSYILCNRPQVASESPILTLRPLEARQYDGGAAIVARHAAALGARPTLITPLPTDDHGRLSQQAREFTARLEQQGVVVRALPVSQPLPEKQRFLVGHQKVMKLDLVEPLVLDVGQRESLHSMAVDAAGDGCDAAILTDFGLGMFTPVSLGRLCRGLRPRVRVLAGDVSGASAGLRGLRDCDLVCPSEEELRGAMQLPEEGLPLVTWRMMEETASRHAIITLGADGLIAFSRLPALATRADDGAYQQRLSSEHVPALSPIPLDPMGCGDSLLTVATLALSAGANLTVAAYLGAVAAAVQVQRLGNTPITPADLRATIARVHAGRLAYLGEAAGERRMKVSA
ncbi:MAG: adenylyltransferase/cytidyltransferase family protein [Planctomycetes bacterium]|nr:adenylyltransferase/cytidyltransferase family protein [Planctomycetota bacterium]